MEILNSKSIGIVHHNKDSDGFLSGALLVKYLKDNNYKGNYNLIPYNYEETFEYHVEETLNLKLENFDLLIFTDCSPSKNWFDLYFEYGKFNKQKIMIIDHHKNKIEELIEIMVKHAEIFCSRNNNFEILEQKIRGTDEVLIINFNENVGYEEPKRIDSLQEYVEIYAGLSEANPISAAYLVFKKYFKKFNLNKVLEQFVTFVSWYDTWRWFSNENYEIIHNETLYLETYLRKHWDLDENTDENKLLYFYNIIENLLISEESLIHYFDLGKQIHEYEVSRVDLNNFQFVVNLPSTSVDAYENLLSMISFGTPSSFINQYYPRKYYMEKLNIDIDLMMFPKFDYENKIVKISMRSIRMDLRIFINYLKDKYKGDGGGHKHAARFQTSFKEFNSMMNNFKFGLYHNFIYDEK